MCYWGTWSFYREGDGAFSTDLIDPTMCTHIIYSFASINANTFRMESGDVALSHHPDDSPPGIHNMYRKTVSLRDGVTRYPKILIAVGGADASSATFSLMASAKSRRDSFINSALAIIEQFEFDGLDMDWEYPTSTGISADKANFALLLQEIRAAFGSRYILTAAVVAGKENVKNGYDVPSISRSVDYLNIMTYDLKMYASYDTLIGHQSALYYKEGETDRNRNLTVRAVIEHYIQLGAAPEKMTLGVPAYGRTYTLWNRNQHNFYDEAKEPGISYPFSSAGVIQYFEICRNLKGNSNWEYHFDYEYYIPYAFNDTQWIGYDDEYSIMKKVDYAEEKGLGGMMLWSIEMDDCQLPAGICDGWMRCPIAYTVKERMGYHRNKNSKK